MSDRSASPLFELQRAIGWFLTIALALGWGTVIHGGAWEACWPQTELARGVQLAAWLVPPALIGLALIAMRVRDEPSHPLGYALVLGALWLPHAEFSTLLHASRNSWGKPYEVLRQITTAQALFREGDKEGDGSLDYGTVTELCEAQLVQSYAQWLLRDQPLLGYRYRIVVSPKAPEFLWAAVANPTEVDPHSPDTDLAVAYFADASGLRAGLAPFELDPQTCAAPPGSVRYPEEMGQLRAELEKRPISHNEFWQRKAPFGFSGTLAIVSLAAVGLFAWTFQLGPFRPRPAPAPDAAEPSSE